MSTTTSEYPRGTALATGAPRARARHTSTPTKSLRRPRTLCLGLPQTRCLRSVLRARIETVRMLGHRQPSVLLATEIFPEAILHRMHRFSHPAQVGLYERQSRCSDPTDVRTTLYWLWELPSSNRAPLWLASIHNTQRPPTFTNAP